jgi:hypothetical protein
MHKKKTLEQRHAHFLSGMAASLTVVMTVHAAHKPGDFPTPPYPPHAHVEQAPMDSSVTGSFSIADIRAYMAAVPRGGAS